MEMWGAEGNVREGSIGKFGMRENMGIVSKIMEVGNMR
jgi:hypothetical protein